MADEKIDTPDPVASMFTVDDEDLRGKPLGDAELNTDPPADKAAPERGEDGKFKGKEGDEKPDGKEADPKAGDGKDGKPETKAAEKPKDTVPLAVFLEKTNRLKEALDAKDITLKQFEAKLAALEAKLPKEQPEPEPDYIEDPKGYVDHKLTTALKGIEEANRKAEESGTKAQETAAQAREEVQRQRFFADLQAHEQRFMQTAPDYHDALAHVRQVRAAQLREFAPDITDEQIVTTIVAEEQNLAVQLARQGRDPVQTAYNLAKHYGYQPKAKEAKDANGGGAKPNGQANVSQLPDPGTRRLPPDQTLGGGTGAVDTDAPYKEGETDPVDLALGSLFPKRRSA